MGRQLYPYPEGPVGLDHRVHLLETQIRSLVDAVRLLAGSPGAPDPPVVARVEEILPMSRRRARACDERRR
jgi:hypothetical protein